MNAHIFITLTVAKSKANGWDKMALATTNVRNVPIYERLGFVNEGSPVWVFVRSLD
ncbi:hypothetical protein FOMPIDRAFT_81953 [Fomitopsis schrenkii]|uniref:N-acetyltransferase domain-containing protein n=1 Tax=Fomitopsis schrenkii TaxID=2126942 RepID=S8E1G7_FOMSC|nr:hypothetical protein FOMPIDRAFT_81953 [Fomitopsis schrenkii]